MAKRIVVRMISAVVTVGMGVLINYLALPAFNLHSGGFWAYILVMGIIAFVSFGIGEYYLYDDEEIEHPIFSFVSGGIAAIALLTLLVGGLTGATMFNAEKYKNLISVETGDFAADIAEETDESISSVDLATARKLGDRTVGTLTNASWYEVDSEYNLIVFQGKPYRISTLNYGGYFKFLKAKDTGIPGYVLVDAVTQEAKYVENKEPVMISESAFFSKDLKRNLRKQYPTYIFGKSFFEVDDEGNPYYITAVVSKNIGLFGGKKVESFIIMNASTGETQEYYANELPNWVDHAFSVDYLMNMVYYNMEFINGYWNHLTAKTGVLNTTYSYKDAEFAGYNSIVSKEGVVFYTGLTPGNGAEANVAFITLNPRTGIVKRYDYPGAEESSAQSAAEGLVQNLGYKATFPNILNVGGIPTYFMVLKDNAGLIQRYSLCNLEDYTKVVEAKTLNEALELYKQKIGQKEPEQETPEQLNVTGVIETVYTATIDGNTYFYYVLEDNEKLFVSSIKNGNKQVSLKVGDTITLYYSETSEDGVYTVSKIDF